MLSKLYEMMAADRELRSASYYAAPDKVFKLTRRFKRKSNARTDDFVFTVGKPNYLAAKFVKQCVKVGLKFPLRRIQLKFWPEKTKCK